ncbi:MAG: hypothetical protein ABI823_08675 [Bryobacteraceae bacterium]
MKLRKKRYIVLALAVVVVAWYLYSGPRPGHVDDEAKRAGRTAASLSPVAYANPASDFFKDMDRGVTLSDAHEVNGRNMWILWTGGNDRFWDSSATLSFGNVDLLKSISSYDPDKDSSVDASKKDQLKRVYKARRDNRWDYLGTVNEPCFTQAPGPNPDRFGLWLDRRADGCNPDPFEDEKKYPGVQIGARGKTVPVGSYYGYASGVVGLRLFPNPDFDEAAAKKWDPVRYYTDPSYYKSASLVRPYRIGMSCGFCHVGPNPVNPPPDPANPKWENLSSVVGAQYLWMDRLFSWEAREDNFVYQIFKTWRPGTTDVSFVSQDNIDNPRTMNAVYNVGPRMELAKQWGREKLGPQNHDSLQLNNFVPPNSAMASYFQSPDTVYTMRVLKDGSDSIGVLAALNRVYPNIGLFSEEWLLHFKPLLGGSRITPMRVSTARKNSVYWQATEAQSFDMAAFLLAAGKPHRLADVKDRPAVSEHDATVEKGKAVFADVCLRCHSSKLPAPPAEANLATCSANYLECWNGYWHWTQTDAFKAKAREMVAQPDFLDNNYLSTDFRVPVTLLQTNACSPLATNAIEGNIWSEFSSDTYKNLPAVGDVSYYQPFTGEKRTYAMPGGGRGYLRPASLVSIWSTAPFLSNNALGPFRQSPSVDARLESFQASITQLLSPDLREKDSLLAGKIPGKIDRTSTPSYIRVPAAYLPGAVRPMIGTLAWLMPTVFSTDQTQRGVVLGPIPSGMPVELLANLQLSLDSGGALDSLALDRKILSAVMKLNSALKAARGKTDAEARQIVFAPEVVEALMKVSKCPDYIINRGHYFGTALSDGEKTALISYLRTF